MTMRILSLIGFGVGVACLLLAADQPKQKAQVAKTERVDFPSGGTLRLTHAAGVVNVEAWDRPDVEITTIKPDRVHVAVERRGNELVIATDFPREFSIPRPYPMGGGAGFNLEYRI